MKGLMKKLFPLIALAVLLPWPVAYGYASQEPYPETVQIQPAAGDELPSYHAYPKAVGGIEPGVLFTITGEDQNLDSVATLVITNTAELIHGYRYLIAIVGIFPADTADWQNAEPLAEAAVSITSPEAEFQLYGGSNYIVAVTGGSFKYYGEENGITAPQFFLTIR